MNRLTLQIVEYCAEEVRRQQDGPLEVYGMLDAWKYAQENSRVSAQGWHGGSPPSDPYPRKPDLEDVKELGRRILQTKFAGNEFRYAQPRHTADPKVYMRDNGWRKVEISVGGRPGAKSATLHLAMQEWIDRVNDGGDSLSNYALGCAVQQDDYRMRFSTRHEGMGPGTTARAVADHLDNLPAMAYFSFEHIHPFPDGNGRSGKILYNWLRGSLGDPEFPPNFFGGIENP